MNTHDIELLEQLAYGVLCFISIMEAERVYRLEDEGLIECDSGLWGLTELGRAIVERAGAVIH